MSDGATPSRPFEIGPAEDEEWNDVLHRARLARAEVATRLLGLVPEGCHAAAMYRVLELETLEAAAAQRLRQICMRVGRLAFLDGQLTENDAAMKAITGEPTNDSPSSTLH